MGADVSDQISFKAYQTLCIYHRVYRECRLRRFLYSYSGAECDISWQVRRASKGRIRNRLQDALRLSSDRDAMHCRMISIATQSIDPKKLEATTKQ